MMMKIARRLPKPVKMSLKRTSLRMRRWYAKKFGNSVRGAMEAKYMPYEDGLETFVQPRLPAETEGVCKEGLPIPPARWWFAYGQTKEEWLDQGKRDVTTMLDAVRGSGLSLAAGDRILEVGCGCGRMLRHFKNLVPMCEVWGVDIWAEQIYWCRQHLGPHGFCFATTTTIPHLPFEDRSFKLVYCGSVFTHIDDLADAWLLEIRRVLAPEGRAYITVHDNHTVELLRGPHQEIPLAQMLELEESFGEIRDDFGMLVIGRDFMSQVFYDREYLRQNWGHFMEVVAILPEAYGYQTAVLLKRRSVG